MLHIIVIISIVKEIMLETAPRSFLIFNRRSLPASGRQMTVELLHRVSGIGALCIERYEINFNCSSRIYGASAY